MCEEWKQIMYVTSVLQNNTKGWTTNYKVDPNK